LAGAGGGGGGIDGRVAGAARAGAGRVAALDHEARHDPVEDRVIEEAGARERDERRGRPRRELLVERDRERAAIRLDGEQVRGLRVERPCRRLLAAVVLRRRRVDRATAVRGRRALLGLLRAAAPREDDGERDRDQSPHRRTMLDNRRVTAPIRYAKSGD